MHGQPFAIANMHARRAQNGSWLGRVEECLDTVYVRFSDGALCKIIETNLDELEPVDDPPLLDDDHPYFPTQRVKGPPAFRRAKWLRGTYKSAKHRTGRVVRVEQAGLTVAWIAGFDAQTDSQQISEYCKVKDVIHLDYFAPTWWQVGDKALLRPPADDERSPLAVALRRDQSDLCVEIQSSETRLSIRWQDGTVTENVPASTLLPVLPDGNHDFHPNDYVTEKGQEDASAGDNLDNTPGKMRTGLVRRVNAEDRTCEVCWAHDVGAQATESEPGESAAAASAQQMAGAAAASTDADALNVNVSYRNDRHTFNLSPVCTVGTLRAQIERVTGVPALRQRLMGLKTQAGAMADTGCAEMPLSEMRLPPKITLIGNKENRLIATVGDTEATEGAAFDSEPTVVSYYELVPHPDFTFHLGAPVLRLNATESNGPDLAQIIGNAWRADASSTDAAGAAEPGGGRGGGPPTHVQLDLSKMPPPGSSSGGGGGGGGGGTSAGDADTTSSASGDINAEMPELVDDNYLAKEGDYLDFVDDDDVDSVDSQTDVERALSRGQAMYGEVIGILETGMLKVRWSDGTIEDCVARSLFVIPEDDDELAGAAPGPGGYYDDEEGSDGSWETASDDSDGDGAVAEANRAELIMGQFESIQATAQSIQGSEPDAPITRADHSPPPDSDTLSEVAEQVAGGGGGAAGSSGGADAAGSGVTVAAGLPPGVQQPEAVQFDIVDEFDDHRFGSKSGPADNLRQFGKKVSKEWGLLRTSLPPNIYVRACESKMDLLRAVLIGPHGTPYEDVVFIFDIMLPSNYPAAPPLVSFYSYGERINPNLYENGKVTTTAANNPPPPPNFLCRCLCLPFCSMPSPHAAPSLRGRCVGCCVDAGLPVAARDLVGPCGRELEPRGLEHPAGPDLDTGPGAGR